MRYPRRKSRKKNRRRNKGNLVCRGSYTLEAACISGVWMLTVFAVLLLLVGTIKKGVYTAKAYEAAVSGSTEAVRRQGDGVTAARERLAGESGHYSINGSKREITVNYEEYIKYPFAGLQWHIQGNAKSKVIRPVLFIEKVRSVKKWMGHLHYSEISSKFQNEDEKCTGYLEDKDGKM